MAKLPTHRQEAIAALQSQLLSILDGAAAAEWSLFKEIGETPQTMAALNGLKAVCEKSRNFYSQLCTLQLSIAGLQPIATPVALELIENSVQQGRTFADAAQQSILEFKQDWNLP